MVQNSEKIKVGERVAAGIMKSVRHVLDTEGTGLMNQKDEMGLTALVQAAERNTVAVVELVLQRRAEVDETDPEDQTALHYAASCGHVEAALKLVGDGESPQKRDTEGLDRTTGSGVEGRQGQPLLQGKELLS